MSADTQPPAGGFPTDWRGLCEELVEFVARLTKHYYEPAELLVRARAALAQQGVEAADDSANAQRLGWHRLSDQVPTVGLHCEWVTLHEQWFDSGCGEWYQQDEPAISGFRSAHGIAVMQPERALWRSLEADRAALAQPEPEVVEPTDEELSDLWSWAAGQDQGPWPTQQHCFARAVLSRWGRPAPAPPAEGEVAELARLLRLDAELERSDGMPQAAARFDRAADLLERHALPLPSKEPQP